LVATDDIEWVRECARADGDDPVGCHAYQWVLLLNIHEFSAVLWFGGQWVQGLRRGEGAVRSEWVGFTYWSSE
jgi:hypothetical protein